MSSGIPALSEFILTMLLRRKHPAACNGSTSRRAWLILAVLLLFSIAAPLNQSKVPPILPILMEAWGLPVGQAGLLMSLFAVTGLVLALPAGFIFQRSRLSLDGVGWLAGASRSGAALGALSQSVNLLLVQPGNRGIATGFVRGDGPGCASRRGFRSAAGSLLAFGRPGCRSAC